MIKEARPEQFSILLWIDPRCVSRFTLLTSHFHLSKALGVLLIMVSFILYSGVPWGIIALRVENLDFRIFSRAMF